MKLGATLAPPAASFFKTTEDKIFALLGFSGNGTAAALRATLGKMVEVASVHREDVRGCSFVGYQESQTESNVYNAFVHKMLKTPPTLAIISQVPH